MQEQTLEQSAEVTNGLKRMVFAGIAILLELALVLLVILRFNQQAEWIAIGTRVLAALVVLLIYSSNQNAAMKMPWIILVMAMPIMGVSLFLLIGLNGGTWKMRRQYREVDKTLFPMLPKTRAMDSLEIVDPRAANIAHYLETTSGYRLHDDTRITYYDDATAGLNAQKEAMRAAQDFIFMEYHAIEDAESWHAIQDILVERIAAGVDVRVFYDDMGSIGFVNKDFVNRLEAVGIQARVFNPMAPGLNLFLNNRDHRKITVIDGKIGFTGGYNLANEYFNLTNPFGQWKDTGVRLEGPAVKNLTVAFLEMWNAVSDKDVDDHDFKRWLPNVAPAVGADGFVLPYADSPLDSEQVGENVYISVAEYAKDYAWYITPYLILTDEMVHALGLAAKRGVDVRVITPGIPDKKLVYSITRSYYHSLVVNGVRIYEYTPGFCHCKMSIADDFLATCGTINMDYRSLYHHFENGCLYLDCQAVADTKSDFEATMAECREVTEDYRRIGAGLHFLQLVLRLFAPLL